MTTEELELLSELPNYSSYLEASCYLPFSPSTIAKYVADVEEELGVRLFIRGSKKIELTDELRKEGMARELINRIQNMRKDGGLEITDRIHIVVSPNEQTDEAIKAYDDYIKTQVLADTISIQPNDGAVVEFDDFDLNITVTKSL